MKKCLYIGMIIYFFISCNKKEPSSSEISTENNAVQVPSNSATEKTVKGDEMLDGFALINHSDCASCHKNSGNFIGPAYDKIAAKYSEKDVERLAQKIIDGGSGVWGEVPMQAHPQISKEDASKMAQYILSVK